MLLIEGKEKATTFKAVHLFETDHAATTYNL